MASESSPACVRTIRSYLGEVKGVVVSIDTRRAPALAKHLLSI